eukprot:Nitzschia sp. Nitz4//scaffold1_size375055//351605//353702//NITZ4_000340-RA/size375055-augustus-gene-0.737-mRNA-1//-1//CDS//3329541237//7819//frame0
MKTRIPIAVLLACQQAYSFLFVPPLARTFTPTQLLASTQVDSTSTSPFPTRRGTEIDSRKIIATKAGREHLTDVRLSHILFATQELAQLSLKAIRAAKVSFEDLASQVSLCSATREGGGSLGWVHLDDPSGAKNAHLDRVFPREARERAVASSTKPGDVFMIPSDVGFHLVQVVDIMADVRKMAHIRVRRKNRKEKDLEKRKGILAGALEDPDNGGLTYKIETMGCQMNTADSERIEGQLQSLGIMPMGTNDTASQPDVVVLNTCSIRERAESKLFAALGPHAKRKRRGEDVTIVVAGCVAQQEGEALLRRVPEVDLVLGPQYANRIADLLEDVSLGNQVVATEMSHIMEDYTKPRRGSTVTAWVNVIYGCNERCTYCIVPTTRGVEQSRPVQSIVDEVKELVASGYQEVTLLGQNIDAYGRDMKPKRKFSDLIRIVGNIPGLKRLRFVTSHPRYITPDVVDAVAETPSACEYFHIPFQSGSNEILSKMGRGHNVKKYLSIIDHIRSKIPDASITSDAFVGFPGETEEDFQDTLRLMDQVRFDTVNTAAYSPRPNTPAAEWENQVPEEVKVDRLHRINELVKVHAEERRKEMVGNVVEVLVEEQNIKRPTQVKGRSRQGCTVFFDGDIEELRGKLVNVKIESSNTFYLLGKALY